MKKKLKEKVRQYRISWHGNSHPSRRLIMLRKGRRYQNIPPATMRSRNSAAELISRSRLPLYCAGLLALGLTCNATPVVAAGGDGSSGFVLNGVAVDDYQH